LFNLFFQLNKFFFHLIDENILPFLRKDLIIKKTLPQMEKNMKNRLLHVFGVASLLMVSVAGVFAQSETISSALGDKYIISAKAGGVNYVEGGVVRVDSRGRTSRVIKGDSLQIGERISTGADGRAEVLLNPGSYVRLGPNASFEFKTTSLDDLHLSLISGNAVFEVFAANDFAVNIETPGTKVTLIDTGIYSIEAVDGRSVVSVWKGRAVVNGNEQSPVKGGREAIVNGDQVAVAKFDRDDRNSLEAWSKSRAKELAKATSSLRPRYLREPLINAFMGGGWNMYSSFGLWVSDPFTGAFCFLPFGRGWSSPYGYWYNYDIWSYRLPWRTIYYPYPNTTPGGGTMTPGGGTTTPGGGNQTPTTRGPIENRRPTVPPFSRMGGGRVGPLDRGGSDAPPMRESRPVFAPPVSIPSGGGGRGTGTKPDQ
jgi:hypothetical protein